MIEITYRHHGQRPQRTEIVRSDANDATILPSSFEVVGVRYDDPELVLLVEVSSGSISDDVADSIAAAFESHWGGSIDHIDTTTV